MSWGPFTYRSVSSLPPQLWPPPSQHLQPPATSTEPKGAN